MALTMGLSGVLYTLVKSLAFGAGYIISMRTVWDYYEARKGFMANPQQAMKTIFDEMNSVSMNSVAQASGSYPKFKEWYVGKSVALNMAFEMDGHFETKYDRIGTKFVKNINWIWDNPNVKSKIESNVENYLVNNFNNFKDFFPDYISPSPVYNRSEARRAIIEAEKRASMIPEKVEPVPVVKDWSVDFEEAKALFMSGQFSKYISKIDWLLRQGAISRQEYLEAYNAVNDPRYVGSEVDSEPVVIPVVPPSSVKPSVPSIEDIDDEPSSVPSVDPVTETITKYIDRTVTEYVESDFSIPEEYVTEDELADYLQEDLYTVGEMVEDYLADKFGLWVDPDDELLTVSEYYSGKKRSCRYYGYEE